MDLLLFRFGGPGLGNLLFPWARAKIWAKEHGHKFVAPTWMQIKLGPLMRGEIDARSYGGVFCAELGDIDGYRKARLLLGAAKLPEQDKLKAKDGDVIQFAGLGSLFEELHGHEEFLHRSFRAILRSPQLDVLKATLHCRDSIAVHVRFGDFSIASTQSLHQGNSNTRQPIQWYVSAVNALRSFGDSKLRVNVFSDAQDEELADLLALEGVNRVRGNNAAEDLELMASHRFLVASGSTFSMWASFWGQMPTLWFPGQKKHTLNMERTAEIEYVEGAELPRSFFEKAWHGSPL